ncbi:rho-related GTP-binding protein RhoD [Huso huso]|uniref:Rho-related GTP-binding protein RhoD n=1 Tax=Huso huso TaxID=61971 RepID=A0ABR0Y7U1_HUSHU
MEKSPRRVSVQQTGHAGPQHASAAGSVKTVIVGDGGCGKTSLLMVFAKGDFPEWSPEVRHFCKGVPVLLVGCKTDLRKDKIRLRKLRANGLEPITYSQGEHTAKQIRASMYLECSAKFQENVADIFKEAVAAATSTAKKRKSKRRKKQGCAVS